jgi:hypothetical protein
MCVFIFLPYLRMVLNASIKRVIIIGIELGGQGVGFETNFLHTAKQKHFFAFLYK